MQKIKLLLLSVFLLTSCYQSSSKKSKIVYEVENFFPQFLLNKEYKEKNILLKALLKKEVVFVSLHKDNKCLNEFKNFSSDELINGVVIKELEFGDNVFYTKVILDNGQEYCYSKEINLRISPDVFTVKSIYENKFIAGPFDSAPVTVEFCFSGENYLGNSDPLSYSIKIKEDEIIEDYNFSRFGDCFLVDIDKKGNDFEVRDLELILVFSDGDFSNEYNFSFKVKNDNRLPENSLNLSASNWNISSNTPDRYEPHKAFILFFQGQSGEINIQGNAVDNDNIIFERINIEDICSSDSSQLTCQIPSSFNQQELRLQYEAKDEYNYIANQHWTIIPYEGVDENYSCKPSKSYQNLFNGIKWIDVNNNSQRDEGEIYFTICHAEELASIPFSEDDWEYKFSFSNFSLEQSIDLASYYIDQNTDSIPDNQFHLSSQRLGYGFGGNFEGNNNTIENYKYISSERMHHFGLFPLLYNYYDSPSSNQAYSSIKNLTMLNAYIDVPNSGATGVIAGRYWNNISSNNYTTFDFFNIKVMNSYVNGEYSTGGLFGNLHSSFTYLRIEDSSVVNSTIISQELETNPDFILARTGGLVGTMVKGQIKRSFVKNSSLESYAPNGFARIGGFIGLAHNFNQLGISNFPRLIEDSYFDGTLGPIQADLIEHDNYIGGFIGFLSQEEFIVRNSYTKGSIIPQDMQSQYFSAIGGIFGHINSVDSTDVHRIENSFSLLNLNTPILNEWVAGGILGNMYPENSGNELFYITNSFIVDGNVSSNNFCGGYDIIEAPNCEDNLAVNEFVAPNFFNSPTSSVIINLQNYNSPLSLWDFVNTWEDVSPLNPDLR